MAYIFMDESGDLGFDLSKKKTSNFFIISFLLIPDDVTRKSVSKIVKKIFSTFSRAEMKHHSGTLHAYKEKSKTRCKVLQFLAMKEVNILIIYLNKKKVFTRLQDEKHVLYNYVTNILLDRICNKKLVPLKKPICLIASRRETNKFLNENFRSYLQRKIESSHMINIDIDIKIPSSDKCLQLVDFCSWAIYRKYEYMDDSYYAIIKSKIIEENPLFP